MSSIMPFIVSGIASGAIYGLSATGLVLTYKTSGIFNFGHGALATAAAYFFYFLYVDHEIDWKLAFFVSVFVIGPLMGLVMELIARRLATHRTAWKIVGTVGLILLVQGLGTIKYGPDAIRVPQYLPRGNETFRVLDVNIRYSQLTVTIVALVAVAALYALFRFTRLGIAMRAVVDDPDLVDIQGTSPTRVRRISWIIGSTFAAMSGVLILPFLGLESITLTFLVVQAFGAAAIGTFSSIPITFLGGLIIGVGSDVLTKYEISYPLMRGVSDALPFIVLIIVMLITPKRRLLPPTTAEQRPPLEWRGPLRLRVGMGVVVLGALCTVPAWAGFRVSAWAIALTVTMLILSLGLLVRTAGIVSLCTATFAAIGVVAYSQLRVDVGLPWLLALLLAGLVAVPVGAIVAIPSLRLSGLFLALATLGFGLLVERLFYSRSWMFTTFASGRRVPRPGFAESDKAYFYVVLAAVVLMIFLVEAIHRGRLGRILRGLGESPRAVSTLGLNINVTRVIVFCIGAYTAAIAGALYGGVITVAVAEDVRFQSFNSIILLAVLALAPFRAPWYALFAGVTQLIPAYVEGANTTYWLNVIFGFFAILVALEGGPRGMPQRLRSFFERIGGPARRRTGITEHVPATVEIPRHQQPDVAGGALLGLRVQDLTVRFGGLVAVDTMTFDAPMGQITGLIGPNGAGKTTTFNACSGLNRPTSGAVLLHGGDISSVSPSARARAGLGRTFQVMELCESLSVTDNVALGRESSQAGALPAKQVMATRIENTVRSLATMEALELCGIVDLAGLQAGALSTGQRRLVELARCLAGPFDVLLLDEPSSGLDAEETARFGELLRGIVTERGCGILLVEHDMSLVMDVCRDIYVMDLGRLIFSGSPTEVAASKVVQEAYLGQPVEVAAATGIPGITT